MNKEAAQRHEEERKKVVMDKMEKNQQQQEYLAKIREHELQLQQKENEAMSRKREYQAQLAKEREMKMKEFLISKFHEDEKKVASIQAMKEREMEIIKEERDLHLQMKRENAERIKRMQEYKRLETMKKITENETRTEEMLKKKEELVKNRQRNAVEAKIRRDKLMQLLEKSKTSGGKAIKKILAQLDGNDASVGVPKKKNTSPSERASESLTKPPQSKKVSVKRNSETKPPSIIELGPPPQAPTLVSRISKVSTQKDYISPYAATRYK